MLKLAIENCGTQLALYLTGDNKQEIEERFYSLWNHGATSGELHWIFDENNLSPEGHLRAYIWTNPEALEKAVTNAMLFSLLNEGEESNCFKGCKGGAMPYAKAQARQFIDSIDGVKNWWRYQAENEIFELGEISAMNTDEPTKQTDWNTSHTSFLNTWKD